MCVSGDGHGASPPSTLVYMRLDIESAEYDLLPHLLARSALCRVPYLQVEWHMNKLAAARRLVSVGLRISLGDILTRGCPRLPVERFVEHDEQENNWHMNVPGLTELARLYAPRGGEPLESLSSELNDHPPSRRGVPPRT